MAYDRIVMDKRGTEDYARTWTSIVRSPKKGSPTTWPVWAEFFVDRDGGA